MTKARVRTALLGTLVAAAASVVAGCGGGSSAASSSPAGASSKKPAYEAPVLADHPSTAPNFSLRNHLGKPVQLADYRGKAVLLTFIYDHCPDVCPLIMGNLHSALEQLGPKASSVQIIAVSVDPKGDTPRTVTKFLSDHEMTGRVQYLIGSKRKLARVWREYGVKVGGTPESREVDHTAAVYGITARGTLTALYPANFKPAWVVHDVPVLARN
jgi:protein SCO1/2